VVLRSLGRWHPLARFAARELGPVTIGLLLVGNAVLWVMAKPAGEQTAGYVGQLLGAEPMLLLSIGLALISTAVGRGVWFDGVDRAAIWHRRVAIAGVVLLGPHILLASNPKGGSGLGGPLGAIGAIGMVALALWAIIPRWQFVVPPVPRGSVVAVRETAVMRSVRSVLGGYERWRALHRTTGLFVAAGFVHGALDGSPFTESTILRWSYLTIGGIGVAFYVYRELLSGLFLSLHDYHVDAVRQIDEGLVEISLAPIGRRMDFMPGQFAMVYIESKDGWHRHPFSISSAPKEGVVRVTVKALGDYTSRLHDKCGSQAASVSPRFSAGCEHRMRTAFPSRSSCSTRLPATRPSSTRYARSPTGTRRCDSTSSTRVSTAGSPLNVSLPPPAEALATSRSSCAARSRCCGPSSPSCDWPGCHPETSIASTSTGADQPHGQRATAGRGRVRSRLRPCPPGPGRGQGLHVMRVTRAVRSGVSPPNRKALVPSVTQGASATG
jgi:hypothetical protein